jgi:hypothetical protein
MTKPTMTPEQINEIDQKVMEIIGLELPITLNSGWKSYRFSPCTDWNDAHFALDSYYAVDSIHIQRTKTLDWYANIAGEITYAATGPLAISLSIIKLHEDKPQT